jgi:hypothetical protein
MATYRFSPGDVVDLIQRMPTVSAGPYVVTRQIPSDSVNVSYRIKSMREAHERVAEERHLLRAETVAAPSYSLA